MSGHVFLLHGDLTRLACDAWLVPSGNRPGPGVTWREAVAATGPADTPTHWSQASGRVVPWLPLRPDGPRPWVVLTIGSPAAAPIEFVEPARQFLDVAYRARTLPPRNNRHLPLLALPVVGAGAAGGARRAGAIVRELLPALYHFTETGDADVALVMKDPAQYAGAQAVRSEVMGERAWPQLDEHLRRKGNHLAYRANRQELVLFLGAGVSQAAGLPSWSGLLAKLIGPDLAVDTDFQRLSPLDQARILQIRLADRCSLGEAVAGQVRADHYSLAHGLLASLPIQEVVTTNYDELFEAASEAAGRPVDVLPYDGTSAERRWLLKLHGCVSRPDDIVLTREDYLRYDAGRAALAGLVQGLLITRHMLFVGFSHSDDNFHRIADAVRRAVKRKPFGTSLSVANNRLLRQVWEEDLDWLELGDLPKSARLLEIFLDRLAAHTVSVAHHLFDPRYEATLTEAETQLRDQLETLAQFLSGVPRKERRGAAWVEVENLLSRLGRKVRVTDPGPV
jgi:hypothetical protein